MPIIYVNVPFKFAHDGHRVEEFESSDDPRETTDDCAEVALAEGWASLTPREAAPQVAAIAGSPENRDSGAGRARKEA